MGASRWSYDEAAPPRGYAAGSSAPAHRLNDKRAEAAMAGNGDDL